MSIDPKPEDIVPIAIPPANTVCSLTAGRQPGEACMSDQSIEKIAKDLKVDPSLATPSRILDVAMKQYKCDTETCVLATACRRTGDSAIRDEIKTHIKLEGPTDNALLTNFDIDNTLQQWAAANKEFYAYNFNMRDFKEHSLNGQGPDTLQTIGLDQLDKQGFKCAACVVNTDLYSGGGIHWMALFADWRDPKSKTVEFFNSSGNAPMREYADWQVMAAKALKSVADTSVAPTIVQVSLFKHQHSKTECGVYSLYYIWARYNKVPYTTFQVRPVPDWVMFEFRQSLFAKRAGHANEEFDWEKFKSSHRLTWERDIGRWSSRAINGAIMGSWERVSK